jgi:hypothetical protein
VVEWSPRPAETVALAAIGLGLALAVLVVDTTGRVLVGAAALLVLAIAVRDVVARPRLRAGSDGVDVKAWTTARHIAWPGLRVRIRETRRFGVRSRTLELDTAVGPDDDDVLVVLGRRDLGTDPEQVAQALQALDPTAR